MDLEWLRTLFIGEGLLFALLGVPLALGRVPPNGWYGFRTPRTLAEPAVWYEINRGCGIGMVIAGALIALSALLLTSILGERSVGFVAVSNIVITFVALGAVFLWGMTRMRSL